MTAREGRQALVDFVFESADQLNLDGWWPRNGVPWADECGEHDAAYNYERWAPKGIDATADAETIAAYWKSLGMSVRIANRTNHPIVFADGGPVSRAVFDTFAPDDAYSIDVGMPCAPGDADKLNAEDEAQRKAGHLLPGDKGVIPIPDPRDQWKYLSPYEEEEALRSQSPTPSTDKTEEPGPGE